MVSMHLTHSARSRKPLIRIELDDLFPTLLPVRISVDLGSMDLENPSAPVREQVQGENGVTNEGAVPAENRYKCT